MVKAFIFDLDGTIVDSVKAIADCANFCIEEAGYKAHDVEAYKLFAGDGQYELIKRALIAAGDENLDSYESVMERYIELFKDRCHLGCVPYEGITDMLLQLKSHNIKLAVLSNKAHLNTVKVIENVFGNEMFDCIQGQMNKIEKKPSPEGAYLVMEKLGVTAEECVYVGDTSVDMMTGHAANIYTVGVTWGFRDRSELVEYKADAIVDEAHELLKFVEIN